MKSLQETIKRFSQERGWMDNAMPANYAKSIVIEAAELLELFQWAHPNAEQLRQDSKTFVEVKRELADVFIYAFNLANVLGVDAEEIVNEKLKLNAKKYPSKILLADPSAYRRIKIAHRKNARTVAL
jgi:NTP pyrophosphatase (non-canonical NTP hydrolase)